ncbi:porin [Phaeovulum sp. W22_SRMD_FR3]|uniref:porin n=1 Tax=Phaeovulum sp. W22_SRMD_FR3 TaxID=3240274 RepID=UPI003F9881C8
MKKFLIATTALALTAGAAAAEVKVSGDGRMGIYYDGNDAQFSSRLRAKFTMTGETDGGLAFGGSFRVDQEDEIGNRASNGTAGSVYISGAFGKLEMGDVVSASEAAIGDLAGVGYGPITSYNEWNFLTADGNNINQGPNILYSYSTGALDLYASMSDGAGTGVDVAYSLAAAYSMGDYSVSLGYADDGLTTEIGLGGSATFGAVTVKAAYFDYNDSPSYEKAYGLSAVYKANALSVSGYYNTYEDLAGSNWDTFGVGAAYDLGGGATLAGGIVDSDFAADTVADFGIKFSF